MEIDLSQMFDYKIGSKGKLPLTKKIATALFLGSGYFAVDGNLPSETILP